MTIYVGARDLAGVPVGTHQFIVVAYNQAHSITFEDRTYVTQYLGDNVHGFVIGAQNRGMLKIEFFETADTIAAKEYFGAIDTKWYKSDFDTEIQTVKYNGSPASLNHKRKLFALMEAYYLNQQLDPIQYPTAGAGFNSNSWAQSVVQYSGGRVVDDMKGLDIFHNRRIPETYFMPYCPKEPRVKLNQ